MIEGKSRWKKNWSYSRLFVMSQYTLIWLEMIQYDSSWFATSFDDLWWFKTISVASRWFKIPEHYLYKVFQAESRWVKIAVFKMNIVIGISGT